MAKSISTCADRCIWRHLGAAAIAMCSLIAVAPAVASNYRVAGSIETIVHDGNTGQNTRFVSGQYDHTAPAFTADGSGGFRTVEVNPGQSITSDVGSSAAAGFGSASTRSSIYYERNFVYSASTSSSFTLVRANGYAEVTLTDVIISGPAGNVTTSYNMHVGGLLEVGADFFPGASFADPQISAAAAASIQLLAAGNTVGEGSVQLSQSGISPLAYSRTGLMSDFDGNDLVTTAPFTVPTNTPFSLTFTLTTQASATLFDSDAGQGIGISDFGHTLTFATNQPVFNLGLGYSADSLDGRIVANQFVPVPEPGSAWLLGIGILTSVVVLATRGAIRIVNA